MTQRSSGSQRQRCSSADTWSYTAPVVAPQYCGKERQDEDALRARLLQFQETLGDAGR